MCHSRISIGIVYSNRHGKSRFSLAKLCKVFSEVFVMYTCKYELILARILLNYLFSLGSLDTYNSIIVLIFYFIGFRNFWPFLCLNNSELNVF
jgi:hypothetical protein